MDKVIGKLTVFFEDPFWVGVFERIEDGKISVAKITFGAEPKDAEVYAFVLNRYGGLRFSPSLSTAVREEKKNPKRRLREVKRNLQKKGIGTKSQQALQLQREQSKREGKEKSRKQKEAESERKFTLKRQKKKDKHRGR